MIMSRLHMKNTWNCCVYKKFTESTKKFFLWFFFLRAREKPSAIFSLRFVVNRIVFHSLVMWCVRSCSKSSRFFSRARDSFLWVSETVVFSGNKTGGRVRNLCDFFSRARDSFLWNLNDSFLWKQNLSSCSFFCLVVHGIVFIIWWCAVRVGVFLSLYL